MTVNSYGKVGILWPNPLLAMLTALSLEPHLGMSWNVLGPVYVVCEMTGASARLVRHREADNVRIIRLSKHVPKHHIQCRFCIEWNPVTRSSPS